MNIDDLWKLERRVGKLVDGLHSRVDYQLNVELSKLFGKNTIYNATGSVREASMLVPNEVTYYSPIEHSERGSYWCPLRTPYGIVTGWSYVPQIAVVKALLYYKMAQVKEAYNDQAV